MWWREVKVIPQDSSKDAREEIGSRDWEACEKPRRSIKQEGKEGEVMPVKGKGS